MAATGKQAWSGEPLGSTFALMNPKSLTGSCQSPVRTKPGSHRTSAMGARRGF